MITPPCGCTTGVSRDVRGAASQRCIEARDARACAGMTQQETGAEAVVMKKDSTSRVYSSAPAPQTPLPSPLVLARALKPFLIIFINFFLPLTMCASQLKVTTMRINLLLTGAYKSSTSDSADRGPGSQNIPISCSAPSSRLRCL